MSVYRFNVTWDAEIEVSDALDEDEAWDMAYAKIEETFQKYKNRVLVEPILEEDQATWGLFDEDPEEQTVTYINLDDVDYL